MSDGFFVPHRHHGMAAFPGPEGMTLLVRNHEATPGDKPEKGAFGRDFELLDRLDRSRIYDPGANGAPPPLGGTTTILYDDDPLR